jgi:hypothetical protein
LILFSPRPHPLFFCSSPQDGRPGVVAKDKILSIDWYGRAAVAGNDYAKERLGVLLGRVEFPMYIRALNHEADAAFEVAKKWENGSIYPQSFVKAAEFYEKAAVKKHAAAANALANLYASGKLPAMNIPVISASAAAAAVGVVGGTVGQTLCVVCLFVMIDQSLEFCSCCGRVDCVEAIVC